MAYGPLSIGTTGETEKPVLTKEDVISALGYTPPSTDTKYTHPAYPARDLSFYRVAVDATGHVSETGSVGKNDITGALGYTPAPVSYGTADLTAGSSALETGSIHLVYE